MKYGSACYVNASSDVPGLLSGPSLNDVCHCLEVSTTLAELYHIWLLDGAFFPS